MNIKMINDKSLKIILEENELEKISINSKDIDCNSPKIKKAISNLLDILSFEYGIHIKKEQKIAVEITHTRDEQFAFLFNCDDYIFMQNINKLINEPKICILITQNLNDIINASKAINSNFYFSNTNIQSRLTKNKDNYSLLTKCDNEDISSLMIVLSEFGDIKTIKDTKWTNLSETLNQIIEKNAIETLSNF